MKDLSPWWTNNPKALFIIIFYFKTKYKTFHLKLFSNPSWKLIEFITPSRNDTLYYYIGKPCTCGFTTSVVWIDSLIYWIDSCCCFVRNFTIPFLYYINSPPHNSQFIESFSTMSHLFILGKLYKWCWEFPK